MNQPNEFIRDGVVHGDRCCSWAVEDTYQCPTCERRICYCSGTADGELPECCDVCWTILHLGVEGRGA